MWGEEVRENRGEEVEEWKRGEGDEWEGRKVREVIGGEVGIRKGSREGK